MSNSSLICNNSSYEQESYLKFANWLNPVIGLSTMKQLKRIMVLTDNEPDDLLFFLILFGILKSLNIHNDIELLVVVGEGKVDKTKATVAFLKSTGYTNFKVVSGIIDSEAIYPENLTNILEQNYDEKTMSHYISNSSYQQEISSFVKSYLNDNSKSLVCCIKPPSELYEMYHDGLLNDLDMHSLLYSLYGSVNNRWELDRIVQKDSSKTKDLAKEDLTNFFSKFHSCVSWVESFFVVGSNNTFSMTYDEEYYSEILKHPLMTKVILAWNKPMYLDDHKKIIKLLDQVNKLANSIDDETKNKYCLTKNYIDNCLAKIQVSFEACIDLYEKKNFDDMYNDLVNGKDEFSRQKWDTMKPHLNELYQLVLEIQNQMKTDEKTFLKDTSINEIYSIIKKLMNINIKKARAIGNAEFMQMVIADFVLPIVLFEDLDTFSSVSGNVKFNQDNFTNIDSTNGNIQFIATSDGRPALDREELKRKIIKYVKIANIC